MKKQQILEAVVIDLLLENKKLKKEVENQKESSRLQVLSIQNTRIKFQMIWIFWYNYLELEEKQLTVFWYTHLKNQQFQLIFMFIESQTD